MDAVEFRPHAYQEYVIGRILDTPNLGVFLDPGMGKTVITLEAIRRLRFEQWAIGRVLIVAPKKVSEATWQEEGKKWLATVNLKFSTVLGTEKQRLAALDEDADIWVINRDNVPWLVKHYGREWPFDMVVLDESSSFKNPQSKRFKALKAIRPRIKRLVELTGTPSPQGLMDLWAQLYLIDGGQRLGRTMTVFRDMWFMPDRRNGMQVFTWRARAGADREIREAIADVCVSMRAADYLTLPPIMYETIPVKLDKAAEAAYKRLERDALLKVAESDQVITAGSAAVLTGKLLQLCNGAVYDEEGAVVPVHDCKLDAFCELTEALGPAEHAIIFYAFQHDRDRILAALGSRFPALRVRVYSGAEDAAAWNAGEVDMLLAQPQSCSYGLNLQQGGRHVIWFGLTWSLEMYIQANRRLYRQGQDRPTIVHHLAVVGGVDVDVLRVLERKSTLQEGLLEALKVKIQGVQK